jgi:hypothetical protein
LIDSVNKCEGLLSGVEVGVTPFILYVGDAKARVLRYGDAKAFMQTAVGCLGTPCSVARATEHTIVQIRDQLNRSYKLLFAGQARRRRGRKQAEQARRRRGS